MKKAIITILILFAATFAWTEYCAGYNKGYKEGYCYGKPLCLEPMPPLCPLPGFGEHTWKQGYQRGFIDGQMAQ